MDETVRGAIWTQTYPVRYAGTRFSGRMTVLRLADGGLWIHSPGPMDEDTVAEIRALGPVRFIVSPGTFHYFHVPACQAAFPQARTFLAPGLEVKRPELRYDAILGDTAEAEWKGQLEQVALQGTRFISEVAFFHAETRTLILVDLLENIGDGTPGVDWVLRFWWKVILRMWNRPKPAPEYQFGWGDRAAVRRCLQRILEWDFERLIISHGDLIDRDARAILEQAWSRPLGR
jgi:hypothetical protein